MTRKLALGCYLVLILAVSAAQSLWAQMPNPYGAPISVDDAKKAAAPAIAEAKRNHWKIAVAVVDPSGTLVYYEKMDDTQTASANVAIDKARSAALFKRPTKAFQDALAAGGEGLRVLALQGAKFRSASASHPGSIYKAEKQGFPRAVMVQIFVLLPGIHRDEDVTRSRTDRPSTPKFWSGPLDLKDQVEVRMGMVHQRGVHVEEGYAAKTAPQDTQSLGHGRFLRPQLDSKWPSGSPADDRYVPSSGRI